eukprot:COSAG02_NODE_121_length_35326_cov_25.450819_6_plen_104_part_00
MQEDILERTPGRDNLEKMLDQDDHARGRTVVELKLYSCTVSIHGTVPDVLYLLVVALHVVHVGTVKRRNQLMNQFFVVRRPSSPTVLKMDFRRLGRDGSVSCG